MGQPSRRNRQVTRILSIIVLLREGGRTLTSLADYCEVTPRTVRRDMEAIEAAGFPLYDDVDDDGVRRWHVLPRNKVVDLVDAVARQRLDATRAA